jgi:membrane protein DedA with SNARE-associated domain
LDDANGGEQPRAVGARTRLFYRELVLSHSSRRHADPDGAEPASSVLGGLLGYAIGYYFYDTVGLPILKFYGREHALDAFIAFVHTYGVPAVIIKGATPIPFKVVTIAAGVAHMDLLSFIGASIIARAMRFYLVAGLLYFFGQPIREFIERRLALVTTVFVVVLVGGFVAIRYLV